jgi:signal transduction histidine kinase/ligand-binding sensor domain-containing protein
MRRVIIALGMLLGWGSGAYGLDPALDVSQYAHTAWKIREGFATGTIHQIAQTPDGYLWLATESGLLRFDGVRAVPWQPPQGEHLPSSDIRSLIAARDGTLWLGTAKGLASWKHGKLTNYPDLDGYDVGALLQDHEGTIWAAGVVWEAGFSQPGKLCAIRSGSIKCYGSDGSLGFGVTVIYEDSRGNLWLGAGSGLWLWRPDPPKHYALPELKEFALPGVVFQRNAFLEGDRGALLISGRTGIKQFVDGKFEDYPLVPGVPQFHEGGTLLRDRNGGLWIGTRDAGIVHIHQGRMDAYAQSDGLSSNFVEGLFEDREGSIWAATANGADRFRDYAVSPITVKQGLSTPNVGCILAASDGSVWLGTSDGLNRWRNGKVTVYRRPSGRPARQSTETLVSGTGGEKLHGVPSAEPPGAMAQEIISSGLPDNYITSLFQDDHGRIWVSTVRGLAYFENDRLVRVKDVHVTSLSQITGDGKGNLWVTNNLDGLYRLSKGRVIEHFPWAKLGIHGSLSNPIVTDPVRGGLWLGSWDGGVVYFKDSRVRASYGPADGLGAGRVNALQLDSENTLWAATDGGLSRLKDGRVATLTSKNGLPCDTVHDVVEDDAHSLWLYMACGLMRIARPKLDAWVADPNHKVEGAVFDTSDGVRSHAGVYNFGPRVAKTADGKLWFLPLDGVSVVDPRYLPLNKLPPPVHIERVIADGETYWQNWSGDASSSRPRLPARVRDLSIEYTALSMVVPEKVHFRFKLEGQDPHWREVANVRQVQYSNLGPGKYTFRVIACNNSGVWNEVGDTLDFSIAPAYWQTNWFRALCVAALVALLWAAYRLRIRVLEDRQAVLERHQVSLERHQGEVRALNERLMKVQEEERIRIAGELHDGVLQKLTSLALQLGTATLALPTDSEPKAEVSEVEKKLIQVGAEIRQLSHELHPAVLQETGLPAALSSYCEEFSNTRGIPVSYHGDESVEDLSPGAALCIYRIAQEALGNVAKHAQANQIEVRLTRSDNRVCLVVSDDGVGFNPDGSGKSGGLGLINMRERVRQLDGTFEFHSEPGRGTAVKAQVPFRPAS